MIDEFQRVATTSHIPRYETSHEPAFFNMVVVLSFLVVAVDGHLF